jgi:hypothetical protein
MNDKQLSECIEGKTKSIDPSRRRFTKSGLAASGVILTLASRPVLANLGCKSPSGFVSGNVSAQGTPLACTGETPDYWGAHPADWTGYEAGTYDSSKGGTELEKWVGGTPFSSAFLGSTRFDDHSMMQVIWMDPGEDPSKLGAHCVAALLNAAGGRTNSALTDTQIIAMFHEWEMNGFYEPTAGFQWTADEIVTYIQSTFS